MWVFICGLEVKTTKVDNHHFSQCTCFSDRFEERTNKKPQKPLHVHYVAKQLFYIKKEELHFDNKVLYGQ